jgi:DegV family protein with EDD domain
MVDEGKNSQEIEKKAPEVSQQIHVIGMIETPMWLEEGGRLSPAVAMIIHQMQKIGIRPLLTVDQGKVGMLKVRTNAKDKVQSLFSYLKRELSQSNASFELAIAHADDIEAANQLKTLLEKEQLPIKIVQISEVTPVLGVHLGPNTVLVGWIKK